MKSEMLIENYQRMKNAWKNLETFFSETLQKVIVNKMALEGS